VNPTASRPNSAFQLDYRVIEDLLSDSPQETVAVDIEPIEDINSLLNFRAEYPRTNTSRLARPVYSSSSGNIPRMGLGSPSAASAMQHNDNETEDASHAINVVISQV